MTDPVRHGLADDVMEATAPFAPPSTEPVAGFAHVKRSDGTRTVAVTATYRLSEEGRKASLLAGGDGCAVQEIKVQVPTNRFHLVNVDAHGRALLKLRPQYYLNSKQDVVRDDTPPKYDAPPSVEDLLKEAARNHQLERAYQAQRVEGQKKRQDSEFEAHQHRAEAFLADPSLRALEHPKPTPTRCYVAYGHRTMMFDAKKDRGIARQVPPEAHRRFSADLRARTERNHEVRRRQLALGDEKKQLMATWVASRGTAVHQDRYAAGMLSVEEAFEAMTDDAFAVVGDRPRYVRDGVVRLQAYLRQFSRYANAVVTQADLIVTSAHAEHATEAQWALVRDLQSVLPNATVTLRVHRLAWKRDPNAPVLAVLGVLVTQPAGSFTLRREYLAPDSETEETQTAGS